MLFVMININERLTTRSISAQRMKIRGFNNNTIDNYTQMALTCELVSLIVQTLRINNNFKSI